MRHVLARRWTFAPTWVQRPETSQPRGCKGPKLRTHFGTLAYSTGSCVGTRLSHVTRTTTFRPSVSPLPLISRLTRRASCSKKTVSLEEVEDRGTHAPGPVSGNRGRHLRTPPTQTGGSAAGAGLRRTPQPGRHDRCEAPRQPLWVTHTHQAGRRRCRGAARGTKMAGRGASRQSRHRRLPRFSSDAVPHRLAKCSRARRGGVGDAGGIEPACTDAPDGARPRGERKDALDTVARRRCRAQVAYVAAAVASSVGVKPQVEASGAGCAAQRASSAPSPPHLHSTRARSAPSIRAAGTSWPNLGV